ncbi:MAG: YbbR-like domain-containing protein [Ignavibacteriales bacterium]
MKKLGNNVRLRVLSVFIAIILWIYVVNIQNPEVKREFDSIPVNVENVDLLSGYGLILSGDRANNISVKLKGNQDAVNKIQRNDIEAFADLKDIKGKISAGKISIPVKINLLNSEGIEVIDKNKYKIEIEMDRYSQVQKIVEVVFQGITNKDLKYEAKSIRPNVITISGPQKLVSNIGSVKAIVDITNSEKEMSVIKRFKIYTKRNTDITNNEQLIVDSQNVQVDIDYQKFKEVPIIPNIVGQPSKGYFAAGYKINPEKILISGHSDKVNPINTLNTKKIDITGKKSDLSNSPELIIPQGINLNYSEDIKADIFIKKITTQQKVQKNL